MLQTQFFELRFLQGLCMITWDIFQKHHSVMSEDNYHQSNLPIYNQTKKINTLFFYVIDAKDDADNYINF